MRSNHARSIVTRIAFSLPLTLPTVFAAAASAQDKVPVIYNAAPKWTAATAWKIDAAPTLEIGSADGADPYLFHNPAGVLKLPDGRIVVGDMGSSQVRFFDAKGKHLKTIGRSGDGPGEYQQISGLTRMKGDSILVTEFQRANVTTLDGKHVRVIPPPGNIPGVVRARPWAFFSDGSNLSMDWPQGRDHTGAWTDSVHVVLIDRNGALVRPLGTYPAMQFATKGGSASPVQFGPSFKGALGQDEYYTGFPDTYRINVFGFDGKPRRVISRAWKPTPVTSDDIRQYGEAFINAKDESGGQSAEWRAFRQKRLDQTTFASQMQAYGNLRVDTEGFLWVQDGRPALKTVGDGFSVVSTEPTRWDIFDKAGVWLGSIQTPARLRVMDIGKDYIAGMYVGADDIESIRVYRLVKPGTR